MSSLQKILLSVFGVGIFIAVLMYLYIPKVIEKNIVQQIITNSKENVRRLQIVREYYTNFIVKDVKKHAPDLKLDYNHKDIDTSLPFPTTVIHDLTEMYSLRSKVKFQLYSNYPFLNRKNRVLTSFQKEALKNVGKSKDGVYYKKDFIDGQKVLRVAVADYMILPACVNCHNTHKLKNWSNNKWKLGDMRGVIEVITPLD